MRVSKQELRCSGSIARFGNKIPFILFIILFGVPIGFSLVSLTTISKDSPYIALVAAFLGGIISLAPVIFINFVTVPDLKIIYNISPTCDDVHRPSIHLRRGWDRQHIRVIVKNNGQKVAKSCSAIIQLSERIDRCEAFSSEPKTLRWVSSLEDTKTTLDIAPYGGEQFLEVIFADDHEPYSDVVDCKIEEKKVNNKAPLKAFASTPSAYKEPQNRDQDGFCRGRFRIILTVYSETAKPCREKFTLHIPDKWNKISMSHWRKDMIDDART